MNNISPALNEKINDFLRRVQRAAPEAVGSSLDAIDKEFQQLIEESADYPELLFFYNEFRIANAYKLPRTRPQILLGGVCEINYPNIHTYPLFKVADVVCLTCTAKPYKYSSAIHCNPSMLFLNILKQLPKGFEPDFFWDNQIEHQHFIPAGIEAAPFPIIASICHAYLHKSVEHVCELFDRVLPISTFHGNLLRKKYPDKIIEIPFGLNWASFDYLMFPSWDKSIDVCVTFGEINSPVYGTHRTEVVELAKKFKEKYGHQFSIEIAHNLPAEEYRNLLRKSRITVNVTGIHGPYNYRVIEAMCFGSMVFQYDWSNDFFDNGFSELFSEGVHGVSFNYDNFESKLLYYLKNPDQIQKIAREAYTFLKENYGYQKLYRQLIEKVKEIDFELPRKVKPYKGYHDLDMIYYYQSNLMSEFVCYSVIEACSKHTWLQCNNLMILSRNHAHNGAFEFLFTVLGAKPLALHEKTDEWSVCCSYYQRALDLAPEECAWIVQWNFFILAVENGKVSRVDIENIIAILQNVHPQPFDEEGVIFKYYVNSRLYPDYDMLNLPKQEFVEFIELNLGLMKVIDKPKERALLYQQFALNAAHYFLEVFIEPKQQ